MQSAQEAVVVCRRPHVLRITHTLSAVYGGLHKACVRVALHVGSVRLSLTCCMASRIVLSKHNVQGQAAGAFTQAFADLAICHVHCPAECPHGVFPMGQLIATSLADMCWPGHPIYALSADAVFKVPLWRHVMTW